MISWPNRFSIAGLNRTKSSLVELNLVAFHPLEMNEVIQKALGNFARLSYKAVKSSKKLKYRWASIFKIVNFGGIQQVWRIS